VPSINRPVYCRPTDVAWCHVTRTGSVARSAARAACFGPGFGFGSGSGGRKPNSSSPNVRLGGSSSTGTASSPRPRWGNAAIGSVVADPTTSASAGTVRVANRRLRAALAVSRRRRDASRPVSVGSKRGSSHTLATPADASARCSQGQTTSTSGNHTSPIRQDMLEVLRVERSVSFGLRSTRTSRILQARVVTRSSPRSQGRKNEGARRRGRPGAARRSGRCCAG